MTPSNQDANLLVLTSNIVTAHLSHNNVPTDNLPHVIRGVFDTLRSLEDEIETGHKKTTLTGRALPPVVEQKADPQPKTAPVQKMPTQTKAPDPQQSPTLTKNPEVTAESEAGGSRDDKPYPGLRAPSNPAVDPAKSIQPDFLICIESGEKFKTLKRHLASEYNMTPEEYRAKWNLPDDYPMVAPNYSTVRSTLAKVHKLGGHSKTPAPPPAPPPVVETVAASGKKASSKAPPGKTKGSRK